MATEATKAIMANPKFQALVKQRATLGWILAALMCIAYFGLIGIIAFDKTLVDEQLWGGPVSVGIFLGIVVILIAIVLVGVYVVIANTKFDKTWAALEREIKR